ncbi:hypothetical protein D3C71_241990 [compost metagenome]
MVGFAVAHEEAGLQVGCDLPADVGHRALAIAGRMPLVAVEFGIGISQEVVDVTTDAAQADAAFLVATAARFVVQLHAGRVAATAADVVDGTAQRQRAAFEAVRPAQYFYTRQPQRFQQFVGRAARAGQRQAVDRYRDAGGMCARATVDARAADRHLGAFVAR